MSPKKIAIAADPVKMATAFKIGVQAGEMARIAGAADTTSQARASSPLTGFLHNGKYAAEESE